MTGAHSRHTRSHRGLAATLVIGLLVLTGLTLVVVALTHRQQPPQAPRSTAGSTAGSATPAAVDQSEPAAAVVGQVLPASAPVALDIPAIGVSSRVQRLGQTAEGAMEVPAPGPHYDEAGWYRFSPMPGSLGPAVIAGHVDSATTGPSVFFRLSSLRPRDRVRVSRVDGSVAVFAVDEVRRFQKARFPSRLVYGNTDHAALRLITCGGPIDRDTGHYRDNVVVLASLVRAA